MGGERIKTPADVPPLVAAYRKKRQEHFLVITLNGAHGVIRVRSVTKGIANRTLTHPREVFYPAIIDNAVAVILAHNHPSGRAEPSENDDEITCRMIECGKLLGIPVLDHVIVAKEGYYSYKENDRLE
jgi:DNA repair protein RadC